MCDVSYWLWLQSGIGYGKRVKHLIEIFGDAKGVFDASDSELIDAELTPRAISQLRKKSPDHFNETLEFCTKHRLKVVTPDSEYYPVNLLRLEDYPLTLFVRGDAECLKNDFSFGVIGSRTPCAYGEDAVNEIVPSLCENGATIISGGALGIDTISHNAAIDCGGKTLLVLGHGHGADYLPENAPLRKRITVMGAVISEYPPFYPVNRGSFPLRNRIISGMSKGVVIIEAGQGSGTFSTAKHAQSQGVPVYVLPGDIKSGKFEGSNQLISEGAIPIFSGRDILRHYPERAFLFRRIQGDALNPFDNMEDEHVSSSKKSRKKPDKKKKEAKAPKYTEKNIKNISENIPEGISKNAEMVYNIMSEGFTHLDEITRKSGLGVREVLSGITELEMLNTVEVTGPNMYAIKRD